MQQVLAISDTFSAGARDAALKRRSSTVAQAETRQGDPSPRWQKRGASG